MILVDFESSPKLLPKDFIKSVLLFSQNVRRNMGNGQEWPEGLTKSENNGTGNAETTQREWLTTSWLPQDVRPIPVHGFYFIFSISMFS